MPLTCIVTFEHDTAVTPVDLVFLCTQLVSTASASLELHPKEPDPLHLSATPAVKGGKGASKGSKDNLQRGRESSEEDVTSEQPPPSVGYLDPVRTVNNHIGGLHPSFDRCWCFVILCFVFFHSIQSLH